MDRQLFPVIPLRDVVLFPGVIMPFFVGRPKTQAAVEHGRPIFFVAQKEQMIEAPTEHDLFEVRTLGEVLQTVPLPDGSLKIVVKGLRRARRLLLTDSGLCLEAQLALLGGEMPAEHDATADTRAHVEKAAGIDRSQVKPWPVATLQKLLEDDSLTDLDRLERIREVRRAN